MTNENPHPHMPTHQHTSTTRKAAQEEWDTLVKMTEMQTQFRKSFTEWITDKGNSGHIVELGEEILKLQKSTGKPGGPLTYFQVMHRVEEAKAAISKGLNKTVAKRDPNSSKMIRKNSDGTTVWVLK
jgi:hypothetical protein